MLSRVCFHLCHQAKSKTSNFTYAIAQPKMMHTICHGQTTILRMVVSNKCLRYTRISEAVLGRCASTDVTKDSVNLLDHIPDIPTPPVDVTQVLDVIGATGEPSLASIGLCNYTPPGLFQRCLELLHVGCDIPWWGCIAIGTLCVRLILFPVVIMSQKNAAKLNNNLPQMQHLQQKVSEARTSGNQLEVLRYSQEMYAFMNEKKINPVMNMLPSIAQIPVFLSIFTALRGMQEAPVESMRQGGLWWFPDLTVPDPYYILPVITSVTLWITIEVGVDTARLETLGMIKYLLRALPFIVLPFSVNFSGAILCYWVSSNFISLAQVGLLRIPKVRKYFNIEPLMALNKDDLPISKKSFKEGFRESIVNMKIARELADRERLDEMQFQRAGRGPVEKTFAYNPKSQPPSANSILARKR
ncbi:mitochondrial inner membrane protein OXA1L [Orussus abietinus]|uniref:mitochondrial inner membrane protein OXA1L n=1 Tax=Orussus abietinus TaxID=222816 RepID=UPI000625BC19|nr:mitochondrial inner membrane protein OXA1L [Orussus abietinus]